jgi:hypothetical protein
MPTRKRNNHTKSNGEAIIPTKVNTFRDRKPLQMMRTAQTDKPRITALATAGRKIRPK